MTAIQNHIEERYFGRIEAELTEETGGPDGFSLVFDAVGENWTGFQDGSEFDLRLNREGAAGPAAAFWARAFERMGQGDEGASPFERMPAASIRISVEKLSKDVLEAARAEKWIVLSKITRDEVPVENVASLGLRIESFVAGSAVVVDGRDQLALDWIFSMNAWPDAPLDDVESALSDIPVLEHLIAYEVGQGSAIALTDGCGEARVFFDLGAGCNWNAFTAPSVTDFCLCRAPAVVLSHCDMDHWKGADLDPGAYSLHWIAPRQSVGPRHAAFATKVVKTGRLSILSRPVGTAITPTVVASLATSGSAYCGLPPRPGRFAQRLILSHGTGGSKRNDSGLIMQVEETCGFGSWLLVGDADYSHIPPHPDHENLAILVVSHHGADQKGGTKPPVRRRGRYARLIYSFGKENTYKHPRLAPAGELARSGWNFPKGWPRARHGRDVLGTNSTSGTMGSAVSAGWRPYGGPHCHQDIFHPSLRIKY